MIRFLLTCVMIFLSTVVCAKDMTFTLEEKDLRPTFDLFQWIFADGEITTGTVERFRNFVRSHPQLIDGATVFLNSPGGSLLEGIRLGEAINDKHFQTDVAVASSGSLSKKPGVCASACVFSYIGGQYRYLTKGSLIGIHRFRFAQDFGGTQTAAISQLMSGKIVSFLKRQRVDPAFFTSMTETSSSSIEFLTAAQLSNLNVVTNGIYSESWEFELIGQRSYLRADQVTSRGENKLLFFCQADNGQPKLSILAMSELPDREEISRDARFIILFIDGKEIKFPLGESKLTRDGGKYLSWPITPPLGLIPQIIAANSIGAGLSMGGGIFSGFKGISTRLGQIKLTRLVSGCVSPQQAVRGPVFTPSIKSKHSGPSDIEISRRVAQNFDTRYKKAGMAGIKVSVAACYASVLKTRKVKSLEYCYLLDSAASSLDAAFAEKNNWPKYPFFLKKKVLQRTSSTFAIIRDDPASNDHEISRWQPLMILVLNEIDARAKL